MKTRPLNLTEEQIEALVWLLAEESQRMNDDGREGNFERSILQGIYNQLLQIRGARR